MNCLLAFDQQQKVLPPVFDSFFTQVNLAHSLNTRSAENKKLNIPRTNTVTYGTYSIKNKSILAWNEIVTNVNVDTSTTSKNIMTSTLKKHLLHNYNN